MAWSFNLVFYLRRKIEKKRDLKEMNPPLSPDVQISRLLLCLDVGLIPIRGSHGGKSTLTRCLRGQRGTKRATWGKNHEDWLAKLG